MDMNELYAAAHIRVLVVDDNVDAADGLGALLEVMGCSVAVAYDGPAGLAAATTLEPHLAFIDLEMPGMNGREVVRQLRASATNSTARLVCLTGRGQPEDKRLCIEAGFDEFITKPASPETLAEQLAQSREAG
jgi:CheY-like chemotaxis protein